MRYLVGVDEAGRGPLAGPLAVGAVLVPARFDWKLLPGVTDSKQLSAEKREAIFTEALALKKAKQLDYRVAMTSAAVIDRLGLARALALAKARAIRGVATNPTNTMVKLDGLLTAPPEFIYQETIVKGDQKELVIGLASILAKVTRDRLMTKLSQQATYEKYNFVTHKGYGTKQHRELIKKHGLSDVHRRSYCKNLIV